MAKKPTPNYSSSKSSSGKSFTAPAKSAPAASSPARNSPIPRPSALKTPVTHELIAKRAYEIHISGKGGSQMDNWLRAERELKGL